MLTEPSELAIALVGKTCVVYFYREMKSVRFCLTPLKQILSALLYKKLQRLSPPVKKLMK